MCVWRVWLKRKISTLVLTLPQVIRQRLVGGESYLERAHEGLIDTHHGAGVIELATVVGRREEGDELALREKFVTVFHHLVGPADEVEVVSLEEARDDVRSERERNSTIVLPPALNLLVGIGPQQIAQQTCNLPRHQNHRK